LLPIPGLLEGRAKHVPGSVGILVPGVEACVVREDGRLAALNEPGELYIRSGSVALGYWKNQEATNGTFKDGWLRTGDRMRIDADGVVLYVPPHSHEYKILTGRRPGLALKIEPR
jgi:acyl-CoA synthetase (AMP-forming)/AMP-acid ligase II